MALSTATLRRAARATALVIAILIIGTFIAKIRRGTAAKRLHHVAMAADANRPAVDSLAAGTTGTGAIEIAVDGLATQGVGGSRGPVANKAEDGD
jgi:hypothetical protein